MLSSSFDPQILRERGRQEGRRRVQERQRATEQAVADGVEFFPLPPSWSSDGRVVLLDESGHYFLLRNRAGEDTALVVGRSSYVTAPHHGRLQYGPRTDTVFYTAPISSLVADLNSACALAFGGRLLYRHADVRDFGEKVDPRKILDLICKNQMWSLIRSLWSSALLESGDIVLLDGALNVVQTPATASADEIDQDLYEAGAILVGLSKTFAPKCGGIVAHGREFYPFQPFIFTVPQEYLQAAHIGGEDHEMIFRLGPAGRTLGLTFGIAFGSEPMDLDYHGLFVSYRHSSAHRRAIEQGQVVKVYDSLPLTENFVADVLIPVGARLAQYAKGVVSPNYPLPAGAIHSHVLFTAQDLQQCVEAALAGMMEGGETLHFIEYDSRNDHDSVDSLLNRFFRR